MRRRPARVARRGNRLRKRLEFPMVSPRHLADQVEGGCTVRLALGTNPGSSRLEIDVRFRISIYDHQDDPKIWEGLRNALWIGFDGSAIGFPLTRVRAVESTLMIEARYPGQGCLDRIRKLHALRLAPASDPKAGVLLEVRAVHPTVRRPPPPKPSVAR